MVENCTLEAAVSVPSTCSALTDSRTSSYEWAVTGTPSSSAIIPRTLEVNATGSEPSAFATGRNTTETRFVNCNMRRMTSAGNDTRPTQLGSKCEFGYLSTIGCTGSRAPNAPTLKPIKARPFVQVPSGNTKTGGNPWLRARRSISALTLVLESGSRRSIKIGCRALMMAPKKKYDPTSFFATKHAFVCTNRTTASKKDM
mmetsp:Transcript_10471/g.23895  ORF Transcript_10471/g.23895 Transcript_10471/m.23895 type:complete len:200 (-) Transcript_10471:452-1051(-)